MAGNTIANNKYTHNNNKAVLSKESSYLLARLSFKHIPIFIHLFQRIEKCIGEFKIVVARPEINRMHSRAELHFHIVSICDNNLFCGINLWIRNIETYFNYSVFKTF